MQKCKDALCTFPLLLLLAFLPVRIVDGAERAEWRLLMEPKFMQRAVSFPIAHAQRTILAPVRTTPGGYEFPTRSQFDEAGLDLETLRARNAKWAHAELGALQPRYVRDRKNVIIYAELRSKEPIIACAVLAPKFRSLFETTLGERIFVAVPNRFVAFVFAALTRDYQQYAPLVLEEYRATAYPVSTEVFELSADGIKAVGLYEDR